MSDIYGEKGFELFNFCFDKLLKSELSDEFREKVMLASTIAGIQIAQNGTSLPHGMGYPLTYFKGIPHGLANAALTMEYLKNFKDKTKIDNMLKCLKLDSLMDLEQYFKKLVNINIDITEEEILDYSNKLFSNKDKLKNHPENVELTDIVKIYSKSLLK
jgi:alcohol dehydrogenase